MAESDDEVILVCMRVSELPIPDVPGEMQRCRAGCLERIWVANSSRSVIAKGARVVCNQCAEKLITEDPNPQVMITREQVAEVSNWLLAARKGRQ